MPILANFPYSCRCSQCLCHSFWGGGGIGKSLPFGIGKFLSFGRNWMAAEARKMFHSDMQVIREATKYKIKEGHDKTGLDHLVLPARGTGFISQYFQLNRFLVACTGQDLCLTLWRAIANPLNGPVV